MPRPPRQAARVMTTCGAGHAVDESIPSLGERRYDAPRPAQWCPDCRRAWRLTSNRDHRVADVEFSARYQWGLGKPLQGVPRERIRRVTDRSLGGRGPTARDRTVARAPT